MPKKAKKKQGLGTLKTAQKASKKAAKSLLRQSGEESIDAIIESLRQHDTKTKQTLTIDTLPPTESPSPRSNASLVCYHSRGQLVLFGGEIYNGKNTVMYSDLYTYDLAKSLWRKITAPGAPTARSAHQSVTVESEGGTKMLVFGGEFISPSSKQFHHFKDCYLLSLDTYDWQSLSFANAGPTARSGHRMVVHRNTSVLVFGGYFDNGNTVQYFNDLWVLDLPTMTWRAVHREKKSDYENSSKWPSSRSGFAFMLDEEKDVAYVYGGMAIEKLETKTKSNKHGKTVPVAGSASEREIVHSDLWCLSLTTFSWISVKKRGLCPSQRVSMASTFISVGGKRRGLLFGGVSDVRPAAADSDNDDDDESAQLFNDCFIFNFDSQTFHRYTVKGKISSAVTLSGAGSKRKEKKGGEEKEDVADQSSGSVFDFNPMHEALTASQPQSQPQSLAIPSPAQPQSTDDVPVPCPRRSSLLTIHDNTLYCYGGVSELDKDRERIFADLWSLDLGKDQWTELIKDTQLSVDWIDSEDDDDDDDVEEEEEEMKNNDNDSDDKESNAVDDNNGSENPLAPVDDESLADYFARTKSHWLDAARNVLQVETNDAQPTDKLIRKRAFELAQEKFEG